MELALSVWLLKKRKKSKNVPLTTVANSSAQKEKKKGEIIAMKKIIIAFKEEEKKTVQHKPCFSPPVPWSLISAMRFLKSPIRVLHMLLPGANETKLSYASPFRDKRMCEHKASPLQR